MKKEYGKHIDNVQVALEYIEYIAEDWNDTIDHIRDYPNSDEETYRRLRLNYCKMTGELRDWLNIIGQELGF